MSSAKNMVESLREVVQDLLVPELKSVKVSIDALRTETQLRTDKLEQLMIANNARLEQLMIANNSRLEQMILSSDEKHTQAIRALSDKLDFAIDIRERLATLEARLPRH